MTPKDLVVKWHQSGARLVKQGDNALDRYRQGICHGHADALYLAANELEAIIKTNQAKRKTKKQA